MAMKCKTLMKPKVRFDEQSTDESDGSGLLNKPRITSIVTLDKPVKIIRDVSDEELSENLKKMTIKQSENNLLKGKIATIPTICVSAPCLTEINKNSSRGNLKGKFVSSSNREICPSKSPKNKPSVPIKSSGIINKPQVNRINYVESNKENVSQRSTKLKEQKIQPKSQSLVKSKIVEKKFTLVQKSKPQTSTASSATSQTKVNNLPRTKDSSRAQLPIITVKKPRTATPFRPRSQVRSEMVKNISGTKPKVFIGPGILRNRVLSLSSAPEKIKINKKPGENSGDKLDRPEYNSILFTIKKLHEAKKEKIVTDIGGLPTNYKNLCLKKMSSALDFSPAESIYHDLIDLSITEKELPLRLMRSKDPQPRQKDLEPRLSDFFVPQFGREYSEAVKIRPRSPQIVDNLSAFKISDRIFNWKSDLNEV